MLRDLQCLLLTKVRFVLALAERLVQESIYDKFMEKAVLLELKLLFKDNPLQMETMIGAQASVEQMEKIKSYLDLGKKEGAKVLCGGGVA